MTIRGMIFDVDGTLVDTNPGHVEAWCRAFRRLGFQVSPERITPEIGKGGDKLVPLILGEEAEEQLGEELRKAQKAEFLEIAPAPALPGLPRCVRDFRRPQGSRNLYSPRHLQ